MVNIKNLFVKCQNTKQINYSIVFDNILVERRRNNNNINYGLKNREVC